MGDNVVWVRIPINLGMLTYTVRIGRSKPTTTSIPVTSGQRIQIGPFKKSTCVHIDSLVTEHFGIRVAAPLPYRDAKIGVGDAVFINIPDPVGLFSYTAQEKP